MTSPSRGDMVGHGSLLARGSVFIRTTRKTPGRAHIADLPLVGRSDRPSPHRPGGLGVPRKTATCRSLGRLWIRGATLEGSVCTPYGRLPYDARVRPARPLAPQIDLGPASGCASLGFGLGEPRLRPSLHPPGHAHCGRGVSVQRRPQRVIMTSAERARSRASAPALATAHGSS